MKIVVLDGYTENPGDLSWAPLEALGTLTVYDRTPVDDEAEIIRRIGDAEAVYTNKTPLSASIIDACPHLAFIGVLATGYNVVDAAAAKAKKIPVCNIPTYGTAAVSQFVIGLLLEICHRNFEFENFEECRHFFKEMINILRQMNYSEFKSDKFNDYQQQLNKMINS